MSGWAAAVHLHLPQGQARELTRGNALSSGIERGIEQLTTRPMLTLRFHTFLLAILPAACATGPPPLFAEDAPRASEAAVLTILPATVTTTPLQEFHSLDLSVSITSRVSTITRYPTKLLEVDGVPLQDLNPDPEALEARAFQVLPGERVFGVEVSADGSLQQDKVIQRGNLTMNISVAGDRFHLGLGERVSLRFNVEPNAEYRLRTSVFREIVVLQVVSGDGVEVARFEGVPVLDLPEPTL